MAQKQKLPTESHRLQFRFWLDVSKPEEDVLAEQVEELKQKRTFAKTIRDGIRLVLDLRAGRWEVLRELFPWVVDAIYDAARADLQAQTPPMVKLDDAPVPDAIQAKLDRLEKLLLQQGALPIEKRLPSLAPIPLLTEGDPEIEVREAQSDVNPALNFLRSLQSHMVTKTNVVDKAKPIYEEKVPILKALDVSQVAAPTFDDDDDLNL